ncbi:MAG: glycosyltransferase family 4 protein [Verrucomicrobiota bacterium]
MMQGNLDAAAGRLDVLCGQLAARYAQRCPSHLLLYHSYAWEAFRADYHHKPRKVLFQYHPHGLLEESILRQDAMGTGNTLPRLRSTTEREREVWRYADLVLCASSFTKHSLVSAGMDPKRCRVVPYGVEPPSPEPSLTAWKPGRFLFVGSGVRRKGLHHLLSAWQAATLPPECELLLVCREMEPALRTLAKATRQVRVVNGASATELSDFFASSMAFVMPSLCEGFGHVYAEALNYGCPILGTPNSCVPDLGGEQDGVFCVPAGNIKELRLALERLALMLPNRPDLREAALRKGAKLTWRRFRAGVVECLSDF